VYPKLKVLKPYMAKYPSGRDELLDFAPELEELRDFPMTGETLKGNLAF